jgi:bacterial/archaeal transporter family-2 protein
MQWLLYPLALLAGLSNPIQSAANAGLNRSLGQVVAALLVIYAVALAGLLLCMPFLGLSLREAGARLGSVPWWAWVGGLCNLCFALAGALCTQRIGSATFTVIVACTAVVLSIVLDRFGVMGLKEHPINWMRLAGGAMAVGGIALVTLS